MAANPVPTMPAAVYLELEKAATFKSEYVDGEVVAMAGASFAHGVLAANLCGELRNLLRGKPCRALSSDLLFRAGTGQLFAYPDVIVHCGPVEFAGEGQRVALNPVVVAEVLSPGTEGFDRGRKAAEYRKTQSVQEYLFISQTEALVEVFARGPGGKWTLTESSGLDGAVEIASLGVAVPMELIYEGVEF